MTAVILNTVWVIVVASIAAALFSFVFGSIVWLIARAVVGLLNAATAAEELELKGR